MTNEKTGVEIQTTETTIKRNYGIDVLRLVSMFMVVVLHVLGQGGVLGATQSLTVKGEVFWGMEIACYCAVNVFAIISGYVGVRAKHKWSSLITLCFQLIFYASIITGIYVVVALCNQSPIVWTDVLSYLFPSATSMWYFSAYFCLFFLMPSLNTILQNTPQKTLKVAGMFVFIVFCCWTQFFTRVSNLGAGYSVLWLAVLYVVSRYMATYHPLQHLSARKSVLCYFVCVAVTVLSRILLGYISKAMGWAFDVNVLVSYTSPTIFLSAIFLVYAFASLRVPEKATKRIAHTASLAFGVYLIYCHPYLFYCLKGLFIWIANQPVVLGVLCVLAVALTIFIGYLAIDWIRLRLFGVCKTKELAVRIETAFGKKKRKK